MANQTKDEWVREWTVYKADQPDLGERGSFSLVAGSGCYTVGKTVSMPPHWKTLVFYPHGKDDPTFKKRALNPWTPGKDSAWKTAADGVRGAARLRTRRLEGTYPGHDIILVRCDGAVTDGTPLLVLQLVPIVSAVIAATIYQDGTGHGGHV